MSSHAALWDFFAMGLRALYFLLSGVMGMFTYLKFGISFILGFVGIKMILIMLGVHVPIAASLGIIVLSLLIAIAASLLANRLSSPAKVLLLKAGIPDKI
jgi:tellurite resistance protein TerC